MQHYLEFRAIGNTVVGVQAGGKEATICTCASVPGWIAEDVAQEIARLLNEAQPVLPYKNVTKQIRQEATDENHTD